MLSVLHADEALIVIDKPCGLLAVPGRGEAGLEHLAGRVQQRWSDALVVHRLDMATSGLMLFARGAAVQRALSQAFAARHVHKRYVAVVQGSMDADTGRIDAPLAADWPRRPRQRVDAEHGKPSTTLWRVLARSDACTRVELEPLTGRSHQLRVHLLSIGHPICGDALYGPEPPLARRLLLHASALAFEHPLQGTPCRFESAPPF